MFEADNCHLLWNRSGSGLLAYVSTDVDTSGKSYYGKEQLYLMHPKRNVNAMITLSEKGGLQEAQWHPNSDEFVVIDDHPPRVTCYNHKGMAVKEIASGCPRNIIRFDPHGQFMWMGGFGNLNGEMSFMHWKDANAVEMLGFNKDETCRYYEYSPDGTMFVTARIHEFIKIDNGFRIYSYNGHCITEYKHERLHQIAFRPVAAPQLYPERTNIRKGPTQPKQSEKKAYVPPHLRDKGNTQQQQQQQQQHNNNNTNQSSEHDNESKHNSNEPSQHKHQNPPKPKKQKQNKQENDNTPWPRGSRFQEHIGKTLDDTETKSAKKKRKKKPKEKREQAQQGGQGQEQEQEQGQGSGTSIDASAKTENEGNE
ncbi:hypothetical protein RFI_11872 [Reticulomyxa filosa]|uniref:Translation initiation factor beta propellor-like domain-containing protein n=1 Tax=Reticulomyxa filosa TaxID=46433 RepID=X6NH07_RETFI|nr:hypothetical protein RFI_11872 [Reticulomyxa filosa]|eukprot:ETO25266.1 hypothetical protein RFI_11872 [Reticulomyxa filosa]